VTLQTIADLIGVSRMTVSNAFSRPDQLSTELRDRILATAAELGYAGPDPAARSLARGTTGAIGVLLTDTLSVAFEDEIAVRFAGAIAAELGPPGLSLTLLTATDSGDHIPARDVPLDGAVVHSCSFPSTAVDWLLKRKLPLVFVDQEPHPDHDSVNIEDRMGARLAAQHLVDLGHRRVGVITKALDGPTGILDDPVGAAGNAVGHARVRGWLDALDPAGVEAVVVQAGSFGEAAGRFGTNLLLDLDQPPTAILCVSDRTAYGVVQVAGERGLTVPDDLSVVGFDGARLATRMRPTLTTVRQDPEAKGRVAAKALLRRMEQPSSPAEHALLPVELVVGDSTAPPR
jgi:DNA-binding LacI/PurR family transcriptional regulator